MGCCRWYKVAKSRLGDLVELPAAGSAGPHSSQCLLAQLGWNIAVLQLLYSDACKAAASHFTTGGFCRQLRGMAAPVVCVVPSPVCSLLSGGQKMEQRSKQVAMHDT